MSHKDAIDKNLIFDAAIFDDSMEVMDVSKMRGCIYGGCTCDDAIFQRMPGKIAEKISFGVADRAKRSAGIRLSFKTNSRRIGLKVKFKRFVRFSVQTDLSSRGFDIYVDNEYRKSIIPPDDSKNEYVQIADLEDSKTKNVVIYFPYNSVIENVLLGIDKGSFAEKIDIYRSDAKPIIFYGSSITHGFCASRPGMTFTSIISRMLNTDFVNLGFSGACLAEKGMAEYISGLEKSIIVCGYDHNEHDLEVYSKNHLNFYKELRRIDFQTPILFVTRPNVSCGIAEVKQRNDIVEKTCAYAKEIGDKAVFFLNGQSLFCRETAKDCTIDGIHPNDLGNYFMALKIGSEIKKIVGM